MSEFELPPLDAAETSNRSKTRLLIVALIAGVAGLALFLVTRGGSVPRTMVGVAYFDDGEVDGYSFGLSIEEALEKPRSRELDLQAINVLDEGRSFYSSYVPVFDDRVALAYLDDDEWYLSLFDVESREITNLARSKDLPDAVSYLSESGQFVVSTTKGESETCVMFSSAGERIVLGKGGCFVLSNQEVLLLEGESTLTFEVFAASGKSLQRTKTELETESVFFDGTGSIFAGVDGSSEEHVVLSRSGEEVWRQESEWSEPQIVRQRWDERLVVLTDSGQESVVANIFSKNGGTIENDELELPGVVSFKSSRDGSVLALGVAARPESDSDWFVVDVDQLDELDLSSPSYRGRIDRFLANDGRVIAWDGEEGVVLGARVGEPLEEIYESDEAPFFDTNDGQIFVLVGNEFSRLSADNQRLDFLIDDVASFEFPPESPSTIIAEDSEGDQYLYQLRNDKAVTLDLRDAILSATESLGRVWYTVLENEDVKLYSVELGDSPRPRLEADDIAVLPQRDLELLDRTQGEGTEVYVPWIDEQRVLCEEQGSVFLTLGEELEITDLGSGQEFCFTVTTDLLGARDSIAVDIVGSSESDTWLEVERLGETVTTADDVVDETSRELIDVSPLIWDLNLSRGTVVITMSSYEEATTVSAGLLVRLHDTTVRSPGDSTAFGEAGDTDGCVVVRLADSGTSTVLFDGGTILCVEQTPSTSTMVTLFNDGSSRLLTASLDVDCDGVRSTVLAGTTGTAELTPGKGFSVCSLTSANSVPMAVDVHVGGSSAGLPDRVDPLEFDTSPCGIYNSTESLPLGRCDVGLGVAWVQSALQGSAAADGFLGTDTKKSVILFQREAGLDPSGEVNAATWEALGLPLGENDCAIGERIDIGASGSRFADGASKYFCIRASGLVAFSAYASSQDLRIAVLSGSETLVSADRYYYSWETVDLDLDGEDYVFEVSSISEECCFEFSIDVYYFENEYYDY